MISSANITHGLILSLILMISIILLVIAGIVKISSKKLDNKNTETQNSIVLILVLLGISGVLFSCAG